MGLLLKYAWLTISFSYYDFIILIGKRVVGSPEGMQSASPVEEVTNALPALCGFWEWVSSNINRQLRPILNFLAFWLIIFVEGFCEMKNIMVLLGIIHILT